MNDYYVYEWYNADTKEVFYVGKGKGYRYKNVKSRNKYFDNYYNKHNCNVRKVFENMTEQEAYNKEIELISEYRAIDMCKCNLDSGGLGGNDISFPNEEYKKLYYDTLRVNKLDFGLNEHELDSLYEIIEEKFNICSLEDIHHKIFKNLTEKEIIELAEKYYEMCEGVYDEFAYVDHLVDDSEYHSHDDFWEHQYKF